MRTRDLIQCGRWIAALLWLTSLAACDDSILVITVNNSADELAASVSVFDGVCSHDECPKHCSQDETAPETRTAALARDNNLTISVLLDDPAHLFYIQARVTCQVGQPLHRSLNFDLSSADLSSPIELNLTTSCTSIAFDCPDGLSTQACSAPKPCP